MFLAEDTTLHRRVALKLLRPGLDSDGTGNKRLLREARAAAALDHPNICAIHEIAEDDGRTFIVMQYVEGETLQAKIRRGTLPFLEAIAVARQVVDALVEAHAHDTIHRDIKPANIMISARGVAKVMDFGLATSGHGSASKNAETATGLTSPGAVLGTVPYMSPEQVRGDPLDARTDLFSAGVVLYELVTGYQPFAAPSPAGTLSAILTEEPQPLGRYSRHAPPELERIVAKALRKDKEARYQTAKDLLESTCARSRTWCGRRAAGRVRAQCPPPRTPWPRRCQDRGQPAGRDAGAGSRSWRQLSPWPVLDSGSIVASHRSRGRGRRFRASKPSSRLVTSPSRTIWPSRLGATCPPSQSSRA